MQDYFNFTPDYNRCTKRQKSVHFDVCDKMHKNTVMVCGIDSQDCIAWKGYKHDCSIDRDYDNDSSFNFHRGYKK